MKREIEYYETASGSEPVREFIEELETRARSKVYQVFELLTEFGTILGQPHVTKVIGTPLWELRILGDNSIRLFYVVVVHGKFLILHGFVKKQQKTPAREINMAIKRLFDYKSRA